MPGNTEEEEVKRCCAYDVALLHLAKHDVTSIQIRKMDLDSRSFFGDMDFSFSSCFNFASYKQGLSSSCFTTPCWDADPTRRVFT